MIAMTECSLKPDMIENGVLMTFYRWKWEHLAGVRAEVQARFDALHRAGYGRSRLHAALLAGQDVLGILPLSHSERNDFYYSMHEIAVTEHSHLVKGLLAKAEAFRLSCRASAPAPRPVRVDGMRLANQELDAAFLTHAEDDDFEQAA